MSYGEAYSNYEIEKAQQEERNLSGFKKEEDYTRYCVGQVIKNEKISEIYAQKKNYIVYRVEGQPEFIKFQNNESIETTNEQLLKFRNKKVKLDLLKRKVSPSADYNSIIANSFALCLEGEKQGVENMDEVISDLEKEFRNQVHGRIVYLSIPFIVSLSLLGFSFYLKNYPPTIFSSYLLYVNCLFFGSLGTALSLMLAVQNTKLDISLGKMNIIFLSLSRLFIGAVSSVIIVIFIKSNVLFGFFNLEDRSSNYYYYILAVMAGFFERFIPDTFSNIKKEVPKEK
jgi:hypothetical protein